MFHFHFSGEAGKFMLFLLCFDAGRERTLVATLMKKRRVKSVKFHVQCWRLSRKSSERLSHRHLLLVWAALEETQMKTTSLPSIFYFSFIPRRRYREWYDHLAAEFILILIAFSLCNRETVCFTIRDRKRAKLDEKLSWFAPTRFPFWGETEQ